MKPRISVITLGVNNLEKAVEFYKNGLGFKTEGIIGAEHEHGAVAFFDLANNLKLALWPHESIAHDTGLTSSGSNATELTLGHNVNTIQEVDMAVEVAEKAGATIIKPAADTFWGGYAGYFQDLDGHVWEVVYNPNLLVEES